MGAARVRGGLTIPMPARDIDLDALGDEERPGGGGPTPVDRGLFALRSLLRRKLLAGGVLIACASVLVAYYRLRPPQYRAETRILAQRQNSLARANAADDAPTRAAWEIIHRRENLIALIKQANLLESGPAVGGPGVLDGLVLGGSRVGPRSAADDPLDALVLILDRKLLVTIAEGTISIELDWPDPQQAYRVVEAALQNFLEARHVQEVSTLDEGISILQGRTAALREELAKVLDETRRAVAQDASRTARLQVPALPTAPQPAPHSEELVRLRSILEAKERAIGDVEEFRRRRLADLQAQHDARRAVYAENHPEMLTLRQDIAALSRDSPQISALREEERKLRQEYDARMAQEGRRQAPVGAVAPAALPRGPSEGLNALVEQNERVREARFQYQQMLERVTAAQVELDTARAAFKYRYNVIWPPQVPRKPVGPNPLKVFGLGGVASLLLALLAASAADWRAGRVLERWQVERGLGLPLLADVTRK